MTITASGSTYIWHGDFSDRHIPEAAGFLWTNPGQWTTQMHGIAGKLREHFDDAAITLAARAAESSSIDSDFAVPCREGKAFLPYQKAGIACMIKRLGLYSPYLMAKNE